MKTQKTSYKFKAGFTLVELLIVIFIVAVLAAFLFPLATRMRKQASSAISISNLRQVGAAIATYAADKNATLPGPVLTDHYPRYQNNDASGQLGWCLKEYLASTPQADNPQPRTSYSPALDYPAAKTGCQESEEQGKAELCGLCQAQRRQ